MTDDIEPSGLLVDLDSIFDTRLGLIVSFDDQDVLNANYNEAYFTRDRDQFQGIEQKDWYDKYRARDKRVLLHSQITPVVGFIREFVFETLRGNVTDPQLLKPFVHVNVWPYKLTETEKKFILQGLLTHIGTNADVEIIDVEPASLPPAVIKAKYSMLVMYEYELWLAAHFSNAEGIKHTCPEIGLVGPRLLKEGAVVTSTVDNLFTLTEERFGIFVTLRHLPISMFSTVATPKYLDEARKAAEDKSQDPSKV